MAQDVTPYLPKFERGRAKETGNTGGQFHTGHADLNIVVAGFSGNGVNHVVMRGAWPTLPSDYVHEYDPTLEEYYFHQTVDVNDEPVVIEWHKARLRADGDEHYELWDHPYFKHMLKHCDAVILVYSCTSRGEFNRLRRWWADLTSEPDFGKPLACKHLYVAHNKMDIKQWRDVSLLEGHAWCTSIGAQILPMSARTGLGAERLGQYIAEHILRSPEVEGCEAAVEDQQPTLGRGMSELRTRFAGLSLPNGTCSEWPSHEPQEGLANFVSASPASLDLVRRKGLPRTLA